MHSIIRVESAREEIAQLLEGYSYPRESGGLVEMAIKSRQALPYGSASDRAHRIEQRIFGKSIPLEPAVLKVIPLVARDAPIGALVLAGEGSVPPIEGSEARMIEAVARHAAATMQNAQLFRRMELIATTDSLTGVSNRRRFFELLDEAFIRADRHGRALSVIMIDADHFKTINDTHGHSAGDAVLRRLGAVLQSAGRRTDLVARYGGE